MMIQVKPQKPKPEKPIKKASKELDTLIERIANIPPISVVKAQ